MKYSLTGNENGQTLTVLLDGELFTMTSDNPRYSDVLGRVLNDEFVAASDFELSDAVEQQFKQVTDRIKISNGQVFLDDDPVNDALINHIVDTFEQGGDFAPLVRFYDKIAQNPNEHSRQNLYRWLHNERFSIDSNGDIAAYKGVSRLSDDTFQSLHSGKACVNGNVVRGRIQQRIGDVVTMPRSEVTFDPAEGCAYGLHAGTYEYAKNFASVVLWVAVNPRDVVSVPTDCEDAKMRVCRYKVVKLVSEHFDEPVVESGNRFYEELDSSFIDAVGWEEIDNNDGTLTVYFKDGKTAVYNDVPLQEYNSMVNADSVGRYYNEFKRNR